MSDLPAESPPTRIDHSHLPADGGLSGLGLVMALAGTLFVALMSGVAIYMVLVVLRNDLHGISASFLLAFVAIIASIVRSSMHRAAGRRLLSDGLSPPRAAFRRYWMWSAIQCATALIALGSQHGNGSAMACLLILLAAWPVALAIILARPRFSRLLDGNLPVTDDKGFEGAAILMLVFGAVGLLVAVKAIFLSLGFSFANSFVTFMMNAVIAVSVIRSSLHVRAGLRGVRGGRHDHTAAAANTYGEFGVNAAFVIGIAIVIVVLLEGDITIVDFVVMASIATWSLAAWPTIVTRFFTERLFADAFARSSRGVETYRRAADRGLTTLGWLLFGYAVFNLAMAGALLVSTSAILDRARDPLAHVFSLGGSSGWSIGVASLQLGAGLALIRMRASYKIIPTIYSVVGAVLAFGRFPLGVDLAIALVVPVTTLALVHRRPELVIAG